MNFDKSLLDQEINIERNKMSTDRMDVSFGELMNMYKNDELIIQPEYQRLFRWTRTQKTALIESILLNIPIPPIFVFENTDGVWELVDGLQRVSTVISFFGELKDNDSSRSDREAEDGDAYESDEEDEITNENKWVMEQGRLIKGLEGLSVDNMPRKYLLNIKRSACRVEILRNESDESMKYELFKRLNSGGSKLTAQEIRNAIYRFGNPAIYTLIEELSQSEPFKTLVTISCQKKRTLYNQELVLRFIAYLDHVEEIGSNTDEYLDSFMERSVNDPEFNADYYKDIFYRVMKLLMSLNDANLFKTSKNAFVPALYEAITIGTAQNITIFENDTSLLRERIDMIKDD